MAFGFYLAALALVARSVSALPAPASSAPVVDEYEPLAPVLNPAKDCSKLKNLVPAKHVSLNWGTHGSSAVNVALDMTHPTVLLEEVNAILTVACSATEVVVAFNSRAAFNEAVRDWTLDGSFVMVTNHRGDCDSELERGFFLASSISSQADALTVTASVERTDVPSTASFTEIVFAALPVPQEKREVISNDTGLYIINKLSLPTATSLYSLPPYVYVTADSAELSSTVVLSGKLRYSVLEAKLIEMSFDMGTTLSADVTLTVDVRAPYSNTFTYAPAALTYKIIDVPGIVSLGPSLGFTIGADLAANAAAVVTADLGASIPDGSFHLDFLNSSASTASGWTPKFSAGLKISQRAAVTVNPFVDVTPMLEFKLLGGLLDLSGGLVAQPRFNNDFVLTASQEVGQNGTVTQPGGEACAQGLAIKSDFEFSLTAFVTQWWREVIYSVTTPVADECYTWI